MTALTTFLQVVEARLSDGRFRVARGVELPGGRRAELVASRTYFSWKGFVLLSQHLLVCHRPQATPDDLREIFEAGFGYARRANRVPLPRGLQFGYMIVPCLVTAGASGALRERATAAPPLHWSLFEFPAVHDLATGETLCFRGAPAWGRPFLAELRDLVDIYLPGQAPAASG